MIFVSAEYVGESIPIPLIKHRPRKRTPIHHGENNRETVWETTQEGGLADTVLSSAMKSINVIMLKYYCLIPTSRVYLMDREKESILEMKSSMFCIINRSLYFYVFVNAVYQLLIGSMRRKVSRRIWCMKCRFFFVNMNILCWLACNLKKQLSDIINEINNVNRNSVHFSFSFFFFFFPYEYWNEQLAKI